MSSSDEHEEKNQDHRQSGRNYTIDLQAFSKSRIRLETELRNSDAAIEILDTYCTDGVKFDQVNPLINPDGANPLMLDLYSHNDEGTIHAPWGLCEYTTEGTAFKDQMDGDGAGNARLRPRTTTGPNLPYEIQNSCSKQTGNFDNHDGPFLTQF